jgi:hypothetical protein
MSGMNVSKSGDRWSNLQMMASRHAIQCAVSSNVIISVETFNA